MSAAHAVPGDHGDDLASLREAHPDRWSFRATVANGRPLLVAEHEEGGLISGRTRDAIERKIALSDERSG